MPSSFKVYKWLKSLPYLSTILSGVPSLSVSCVYIPRLTLVSEITLLSTVLLTASSLLPHAVKDISETLASIAAHIITIFVLFII